MFGWLRVPTGRPRLHVALAESHERASAPPPRRHTPELWAQIRSLIRRRPCKEGARMIGALEAIETNGREKGLTKLVAACYVSSLITCPDCRSSFALRPTRSALRPRTLIVSLCVSPRFHFAVTVMFRFDFQWADLLQCYRSSESGSHTRVDTPCTGTIKPDKSHDAPNPPHSGQRLLRG